uniref:LIM zinc-binding domain-containing protein n=1 Tax=Anopheles atroparvus TaxID=41427 RepID=A0AAG5DX78_ANOAO
MVSQMDGQQGFHHMNSGNGGGPVKHCAGCGGKITERFFLHALDRYWHNSCLKCSCCGAMLADIGSSCYTRSGMILCKADYSRLFGTGACSACHQTIPANEFSVPQHHVFHLKCFQCSKCGSHLVQGDRYYMLGGSLVCEPDWHKLVKTTTNQTNPPLRKGKVGRPRRSRD